MLQNVSNKCVMPWLDAPALVVVRPEEFSQGCHSRLLSWELAGHLRGPIPTVERHTHSPKSRRVGL
jgi:hypothetical protein